MKPGLSGQAESEDEMIRIEQLRLRVGHTGKELRKKVERELKARPGEVKGISVARRSLDARKKPELSYCYTVDVEVENESAVLTRAAGNKVKPSPSTLYRFPESGTERLEGRPAVIGAGPAGLFCAYMLALHGYRPVLFERGEDVDTRVRDVEEFFRGGELRKDSNVQFGEGGAGTFSDGKLNTLVKDREGRAALVLGLFHEAGAPEEILYEAKPHVGTDILVGVVRNLRRRIEDLGGEVHFRSKMTDIQIKDGRLRAVEVNGSLYPAGAAVLAVGHSARDTVEMLCGRGIPMEAKAFAVGLRVEHSQEWVDLCQYGRARGELPPASYKVTAQTPEGRGVYSFCMCPGGYVVNASSEQGRLSVNGMSYSGRGGKNANSAIVVSVTPADYGDSHPLAGIAFQRRLEEAAYRAGEGRIPVERYGEFKAAVLQSPGTAPEGAGIEPCIKGGWKYADVHGILPPELNLSFIRGMEEIDRKMPGFASSEVLLSGVESRTSSPVRIPREMSDSGRGRQLQSVAVEGLYPCGEGAGYAGGIMSAAMDGIKAAEAIAARFARPR